MGLNQGPILFICYINDLEKHLLYSRAPVFANDTALFVTGNTAAEISQQLNIDLKIVSRYLVRISCN